MIKHVIAVTQYRENYGAHAWDGKGECPQYWKSKGGDEVEVANFDTSKVMADEKTILSHLFPKVQATLNHRDNYAEVEVLSLYTLSDGEMTEEEAMQMEYYGKIQYPRRHVDITQ